MAAVLEHLIKRDGDNDDDTVCETDNEYNGRMNIRILSVFIVMISSGLGAFFPILSSRYSFIRLPDWCFFIAKFFGSGVIIATAFIHLLQPANEALSTTCLGGTWLIYPWAFGICLISLFLLFLSEIVAHHYISRAFGINGSEESAHSHSHFGNVDNNVLVHDDEEAIMKDSEVKQLYRLDGESDEEENGVTKENETQIRDIECEEENSSCSQSQGQETQKKKSASRFQILNSNFSSFSKIKTTDHFSHDQDHQEPSQMGTLTNDKRKEQYLNQVFAVFVLEFGILFHTVFVGLSLAVSGEEFITLFIVIVFHQMFEGLGLGARIAETNWPKDRKLTPYFLALGFTLCGPIAIAIGLGVRHSFAPGSRKSLISNGIFDSISSGILIYTGLVELMAHEFLFSSQFKGPDGVKRMLWAYFVMCLGAGLMALLGRWA